MKYIILLISCIYLSTTNAQNTTLGNITLKNMSVTTPNENAKIGYVDENGVWRATNKAGLEASNTILKVSNNTTLSPIPNIVLVDCSQSSVVLNVPYGTKNGQVVNIERLPDNSNNVCTVYANFYGTTTCNIYTHIRISIIWDAVSNKWHFDF